MKTYTSREMDKILIRNGFEVVGYPKRGSSHKKYKRGDSIVIVNSSLHEVVARRIIKENNLVLTKKGRR